MLSVKAIIIGTASVATVGGVSFLTLRAMKEEEQEEFELNKFNTKWEAANGDFAKMKLLEEELVKLCNDNANCSDKEQIRKAIDTKPDLKKFFEEKKFGDAAKSGFNETCKQISGELKFIKVYCP